MGAHNSNSSSSSSSSSIRPSSDRMIRKIVIFGDRRTGKTSLMRRFVMDVFYERREADIGVDFNVKTLHLDGRDIKVLVLDTHTLRNCIIPNWSRGCNGVVIVYDVTNQKSFNNLERFLEHIDDVRGENIVDRLIIGNKCDLTTQRVVEYTTAKEFTDKHGIPLVEASAKTGINVDQAFLRLLVAVMKRTSEQSLCISDSRT